jgi:beta-phosphoglucomutase
MHVTEGYAVLWDMDGVLVDSGSLHRRAWRIFLEQRGLSIGDRVFALGFGRPNEEVLPDFFGPALSGAEIAQLSAEKERCYRDLVTREGICPTPGIRFWLEQFCQAGIRQAVATSGCRANADLVLAMIDAARYMKTIVSAGDVLRGKPEPDLFLKAAELLGIHPSRCLVIEDSVYGVQAAQKANMHCLALATTHTADQIQGCDWVVPDMRSFSWAIWLRLFGGCETCVKS